MREKRKVTKEKREIGESFFCSYTLTGHIAVIFSHVIQGEFGGTPIDCKTKRIYIIRIIMFTFNHFLYSFVLHPIRDHGSQINLFACHEGVRIFYRNYFFFSLFVTFSLFILKALLVDEEYVHEYVF